MHGAVPKQWGRGRPEKRERRRGARPAPKQSADPCARRDEARAPAGGIEHALRDWSWFLLLRPIAPKEEPRRPARRFPKERNQRLPESRAHPAAFRYAARAERRRPGSIRKRVARARRHPSRA